MTTTEFVRPVFLGPPTGDSRFEACRARRWFRTRPPSQAVIPLDEMSSRTRLLNACRGKPVDCTPVWFMRQAGRIFPEYRQLRDRHDFMTVCRTPELNSRVTRMPVEKLPVDAAIIFSDIMVPVEGMGVDFELVSGTGPVIDSPIRSPDDVQRLRVASPEEDLDFMYESIRRVVDDLPPEIPLIGFAGAPFTLACYLIEGRPSRDFNTAKRFMLQHPDGWTQLMEKLTERVTRYLIGQIEAGAEVVQLFDSWVGGLSPPHFRRGVLPYVRSIFRVLESSEAPGIYFGTETAGLMGDIADTGADVIGVDWRVELAEAHRRLTAPRPLQGNLDPSLLLTSFSTLKPDLDRLLKGAEALPGHVFNLGHGVLPDTSPDLLNRLAHYVKRVTRQPPTPREREGSTRPDR